MKIFCILVKQIRASDGKIFTDIFESGFKSEEDAQKQINKFIAEIVKMPDEKTWVLRDNYVWTIYPVTVGDIGDNHIESDMEKQLRGALEQQYKQGEYAKAFMDLHYKFEEELRERIKDLEKKNIQLVKEIIKYEPNR
jgi:hypothetical protein